MENIFELQNTKCSYSGGKIVLEIKELIIPAGNIIFFVGPSGIGKSTILETLGMMNNTLHSSDKFTYNTLDMRQMWRNQRQLTKLRNNDFSFIFQQNNLMPNFSAHENAMTAALFQGMRICDATNRLRDIFHRLDLPDDDRPIYEFSGGQQQRIAFARAVLPKFSVLFGDEPTGNLDCNTAETLMRFISDEVHQNQTTAIIVSHDMHLATKYADRIIQIRKVESKEKNKEKNKKQEYGLIDSQSVFVKKEGNWIHQSEQYTNETLYNKLINELK